MRLKELKVDQSAVAPWVASELWEQVNGDLTNYELYSSEARAGQKVHPGVAFYYSEYISCMLNSDFDASDQNKLYLDFPTSKGSPIDSLDVFISFLYCRSLKIPFIDTGRLLEFADYLRAEKLILWLEYILYGNLQPCNALWICAIAKRYGLNELSEKAYQVAASRIVDDSSLLEGVEKLSYEDVFTLVRDVDDVFLKHQIVTMWLSFINPRLNNEEDVFHLIQTADLNCTQILQLATKGNLNIDSKYYKILQSLSFHESQQAYKAIACLNDTEHVPTFYTYAFTSIPLRLSYAEGLKDFSPRQHGYIYDPVSELWRELPKSINQTIRSCEIYRIFYRRKLSVAIHGDAWYYFYMGDGGEDCLKYRMMFTEDEEPEIYSWTEEACKVHPDFTNLLDNSELLYASIEEGVMYFIILTNELGRKTFHLFFTDLNGSTDILMHSMVSYPDVPLLNMNCACYKDGTFYLFIGGKYTMVPEVICKAFLRYDVETDCWSSFRSPSGITKTVSNQRDKEYTEIQMQYFDGCVYLLLESSLHTLTVSTGKWHKQETKDFLPSFVKTDSPVDVHEKYQLLQKTQACLYDRGICSVIHPAPHISEMVHTSLSDKTTKQLPPPPSQSTCWIRPISILPKQLELLKPACYHPIFCEDELPYHTFVSKPPGFVTKFLP